jgi:hypothetical protein
MADETTYGTITTPTRFLEFTDESLKLDIQRIESKGLRPNRRVLSVDDWVAGRQTADGDVNFEVANKGFGLVFKHMMGTIATSQPNAGSFPTVYEHKATVGQLDGKSFTCQVGRTGVDGTTRAFTYAGSKVDTWELGLDVNGLLMLKLSLDAQSEATGTALASASYAASSVPLAYVGGAITVGGTATDVQKFSLSGNNNLNKDRVLIRATTPTLKKEQLEGADLREYAGTMDAEFTDLTAYNRFVNGTIGAFTAFFTGSNIASTYNYAVEVTCAAVRFDGETPNVGGPGIITQTLPFKVLDSSATDGPVSIVYRTTDTTP